MYMTTMTIAPEGLDVVQVVASNIRAEAARRGLFQSDIADALGVQQATISKRWRGGRAWPLEDLGPVADLLGVSVADLVTPHGEADGRPTGTRTRNPRIKSPLLYH